MADWRSIVRSKAPTREDAMSWRRRGLEYARTRPEPEPEPEPELEPDPTYYTRKEIFEAVKEYIDAAKRGEGNIGDFVKLVERVSPADKAFAQQAVDVVSAYSRGEGNLQDFVRLAEAAAEQPPSPPPPSPEPSPEPAPEPEPAYYTRLEIFEEVKKYIEAKKKGEADITDFARLVGRVSPNDKAYAQMAVDVVDAYSRGKGNIADFVRLAEATHEPTPEPEPPPTPPSPPPPTPSPPSPPPPPTPGPPPRPSLSDYPRLAQPSIPTPKPEYETPGRPRGRGSFLNPYAWKKARNKLWWK